MIRDAVHIPGNLWTVFTHLHGSRSLLTSVLGAGKNEPVPKERCKMIDVRQELLDEANRAFKEKIRIIEAAKDLFPVINKFKTEFSDMYIWANDTGANIWIWGYLKKKEAIKLLDEIFWSSGIATTDPEIGAGVLKVFYTQGDKTLEIKFDLKQGDGCFKVPVGHTTTPVYEWRCT